MLAFGIVLNRPLSMTLSEVFEQMKIEPTDPLAADPVALGPSTGSVSTRRSDQKATGGNEKTRVAGRPG